MGAKEYFGARLKTLRMLKNLSQTELAEKLEISRGAISYYENGSRIPDIDTLDKISIFFNVSFDFLLGRTDLAEEKSSVIFDEAIEAIKETGYKYGSMFMAVQRMLESINSLDFNNYQNEYIIERINGIIWSIPYIVTDLKNADLLIKDGWIEKYKEFYKSPLYRDTMGQEEATVEITKLKIELWVEGIYQSLRDLYFTFTEKSKTEEIDRKITIDNFLSNNENDL